MSRFPMKPDETYRKMLQTAEAVDVWNEVFALRGYVGVPFNGFWRGNEFVLVLPNGAEEIERPPDLGEVWRLLEETTTIEFRVTSSACRTVEKMDSAGNWNAVAPGLNLLPALMVLLVGHEWDAERGDWRR